MPHRFPFSPSQLSKYSQGRKPVVKTILMAGSVFLALSSMSVAQDMPMTCDATNMANLEAEVKKAPSDAEKATAQSFIGEATVAMNSGKTDECVAAMQKARMAIDGQ